MSNKSRSWIVIGLIGLIAMGAVLIAVPLFSPSANPLVPTPIPTAISIDQGGVPYPAVPRISVDEARAAQQSQQAVFVDVRSANQYAQSHVPGAQLIPLSELENRLTELDKAQWIITYCT